MLTTKQIQKILREWKADCNVTHIVLFRYRTHGELTVYTDRPGYMIGLHGKLVYKYTERFKSLDNNFDKILFIETHGIA